MFASHYWPNPYYALRYWPNTGADSTQTTFVVSTESASGDPVRVSGSGDSVTETARGDNVRLTGGIG